MPLSATYYVPTLKTKDGKKVLQQLKLFSENDVDAAAEALNDMPIKRLYMVVEMAIQGESGGSAEAIYSECLQDIVRYQCFFYAFVLISTKKELECWLLLVPAIRF